MFDRCLISTMDNAVVVSEKEKIIYIRIGKVAGSSIHRYLLEKEVPDLMFPPNKNWKETFKREDYFVFTFVRNPWDRMVSIWNYHKAYLPSFKEFIRSDFKYNINIGKRKGKQKQSIYNHSQQMVDYFFTDLDYVGRFENLEDDWKYVAGIIGVSQELQHINKGGEKLHYTKYYDDSDVEIVRKLFKDDIETFNYKFGED